MGIFDWLFGKKETPSETKKDCCSKKEVQETKKKTTSKPKKEKKEQDLLGLEEEGDVFIKNNKNLKNYTSKLDGSIYEGNNLQELIKSSGMLFKLIKMNSIVLKKEKKGSLIMDKIFYDWESIKQFIKLQIQKEDKTSFVMNLEGIGFCDFEFGRLRNKELTHLTRFYMGQLSEEELDEKFGFFLIHTEYFKK